jgi:hypothetical protein
MTILISSREPATINFANCGAKISPAFELDNITGQVIDIGPSPNINTTTVAPNQRWVKLGTSTLQYVNALGTADWTATAASVVATTGAQPIKGCQFNAAGTEFYVCYMHPSTATTATFDIVKFTAATGAFVTTQVTPGTFTFGGNPAHTHSTLVQFDEAENDIYVITTCTNAGSLEHRMWRVDMDTGNAFNIPAPIAKTSHGGMTTSVDDHFLYEALDHSFTVTFGFWVSSAAQTTNIGVTTSAGFFRFTTDFPPYIFNAVTWGSDTVAITDDTIEYRQIALSYYAYVMCFDRAAFDAEIKNKLFKVYGAVI